MAFITNQHQKTEENILKNISIFASLTTNELEEISKIIIKKHFSKEQIILFEEDTPNYMYVMYKGKARVVKMNEEGREQILSIHKKGDFFGEMALLDGKTAPATVIAHEESIIGLLSKKDFEHHLITHDKICLQIVNLLCQRLRDAWAMIKILSFDDAEHRIIAVLNHLKQLYGVKESRGVIINLKLTHQQIANYTALSRETVTRVMSRLNTAGDLELLDDKRILLKVDVPLNLPAVKLKLL